MNDTSCPYPLRIFRRSWVALSWIRQRGVKNDWRKRALKLELFGMELTIGRLP